MTVHQFFRQSMLQDFNAYIFLDYFSNSCNII